MGAWQVALHGMLQVMWSGEWLATRLTTELGAGGPWVSRHAWVPSQVVQAAAMRRPATQGQLPSQQPPAVCMDCLAAPTTGAGVYITALRHCQRNPCVLEQQQLSCPVYM
jgi:hypothetical protein